MLPLNIQSCSISYLINVELQLYNNHHKGNTIEEQKDLKILQHGKFCQKNVSFCRKAIKTIVGVTCQFMRSWRLIQRIEKAKNLARSTMSQPRLSHTLICYVHRSSLQNLSNEEIAKEFIGLNDARIRVFGNEWNVWLKTMHSYNIA